MLPQPLFVNAHYASLLSIIYEHPNHPTDLIGSLAGTLPGVLISGLTVIGVWLLGKVQAPKAVIRGLLTLTFVVASLLTTWNTNRKIRAGLAIEAEHNCAKAFDSTEQQTADWKDVFPDTKHKLVVLDQGIAKIMSHTFVLLKNTYPDSNIRTISLHMVSGEPATRAWNVIQEGELHKDAAWLPYPASLVGKAIEKNKQMYCPDLDDIIKQQRDCREFTPTGLSPSPDYKSLICWPLSATTEAGNVFSGVCLDSRDKHAFDGKEAAIRDSLNDSIDHLSIVMARYRKVAPALPTAD